MGKEAAGPARPGEAGPGWAGGGPAAPGEVQGGGGRSRDAHGTGNRGERDRDRAGGGGRGAPGVWIGECLSGVGGLQRAPPHGRRVLPRGGPAGAGGSVPPRDCGADAVAPAGGADGGGWGAPTAAPAAPPAGDGSRPRGPGEHRGCSVTGRGLHGRGSSLGAPLSARRRGTKELPL